jgi:ABC-type lipoprotein export system ATPase subunit
MGLIDELQGEQASFVIVTHDANIAAHMGRICELSGGSLVERRADS